MSYYRRYYRKYYSKYPTSLSKRSRGQFYAAKQQNDNMTFVVNSNHVFNAYYDKTNDFGTAAINVWDVLCRNSNFFKFNSMYDSVKIDEIRVKLSVAQVQAGNNVSQINNYINVYTAWDRTGLSLDQIKLYDNSGNEISSSNYDSTIAKKYRVKIGKAIVNTSSADKSVINPYQKWQKYLKLSPKATDKSQFISTYTISKFADTYNADSKFNIFDSQYDNMTVNQLVDNENPASPFESSAVRYKPTLLVGVFNNGYDQNTGSPLQYENVTTPGVIFNAEFSICCTFKNMKGAE